LVSIHSQKEKEAEMGKLHEDKSATLEKAADREDTAEKAPIILY
jgi:hypothetical protein